MTASPVHRLIFPISYPATTPAVSRDRQDVVMTLAAKLTAVQAVIDDLAATTFVVGDQLDQIKQLLASVGRRAGDTARI